MKSFYPDSDGPVNKKRRSFLNLLLGASFFLYFSSILGVIFRFLIPNKQKKIKEFLPVNLGKIDALPLNPRYNKKNDSLIFSFNGEPSILIKDFETNKYKALNAVCTHLGCVVEYKKEKDILYCNCHGGVYSNLGKNISGPPPKPLEKYDVLEEEGQLIIKKNNKQKNEIN